MAEEATLDFAGYALDVDDFNTDAFDECGVGALSMCLLFRYSRGHFCTNAGRTMVLTTSPVITNGISVRYVCTERAMCPSPLANAHGHRGFDHSLCVCARVVVELDLCVVCTAR
jgi:hypothetical protein